MKMFFTCISKLHSSLYLSAHFQSNVGCFSTGPQDLAAASTGLALHWSLSAVMPALAVSITGCITALVLHCSAAFFIMLFLEAALCESACIFYLLVCLV